VVSRAIKTSRRVESAPVIAGIAFSCSIVLKVSYCGANAGTYKGGWMKRLALLLSGTKLPKP
jgi:hypothetical protein